MAGNMVKEMTINFRKLDKFEEHDFRRWQMKMHFLLTTLKVVYVLTTPMSELLEDATVEAIRIRAKWENDDYICRGHILNGIIHETTTPYIPQQNGVAERKNRALKEMFNSMLSYSGLSEGFWREAMAVVRLLDPKRKTLGEKGIDCIFVGYAEHFKAYRFYVIKLNDSVSINSIIKSSDAIFNENHFSSIPRPKDIIPNSVESQRDDHSDDVPKAIDDEIGSIMENNTWVLSNLPHGCKWIFKRMMKVNGTIDKFKARLVIQGFRQKEGIDYFDTYALVAHITTIRLLLALAAIHNLVIHQMDVKTAFLNGDLEEEVYIKEPKGFVMPGNEHKLCKLVKSLYGLKQAPKQWHQKFDEQTCNTGSTMEYEFVALVAAGKEVEWLRNLIHEIPIWPKPIALISIHCDSAATLAKAYSQIYNGKSRHLGVKEAAPPCRVKGQRSLWGQEAAPLVAGVEMDPAKVTAITNWPIPMSVSQLRAFLGLTEAVAKFRHYLFSYYFIIRTDHHNLRHISDQTIEMPEQQALLPKLLGYNFHVEYKAGTSNGGADEFWYNSAFQTSIGVTPFKVVYGRDPPSVITRSFCDDTPADVIEKLQQRDAILAQLKINLGRAQAPNEEIC
nr:zinc finger, CCHC-type [Tanacetum cinerariifolium]